jgi:hypothetical protein
MELSGQLHPPAHWMGGWVGPNVGLDAVLKRKVPVPAGNVTELPRPFPSMLHEELNYSDK